MQCKFKVAGRVRRDSSSLATFIRNLPAKDTFFRILPGSYDEPTDSTPVTVFALLSDGEVAEHLNRALAEEGKGSFEGITESRVVASLGHPQTLKVISDLRAVVLAAFPDAALLDEDSQFVPKLSPLPVRMFIARAVNGRMDGVPVFLAGDAAMGQPLEKGLSYGWWLASQLCETAAFSRSWDLALQSHAAHFSVASFSAFERVRADLKAYRSIVRGAGILRSVINAATGGHAAALVTNLKKAKPTKAH